MMKHALTVALVLFLVLTPPVAITDATINSSANFTATMPMSDWGESFEVTSSGDVLMLQQKNDNTYALHRVTASNSEHVHTFNNGYAWLERVGDDVYTFFYSYVDETLFVYDDHMTQRAAEHVPNIVMQADYAHTYTYTVDHYVSFQVHAHIGRDVTQRGFVFDVHNMSLQHELEAPAKFAQFVYPHIHVMDELGQRKTSICVDHLLSEDVYVDNAAIFVEYDRITFLAEQFDDIASRTFTLRTMQLDGDVLFEQDFHATSYTNGVEAIQNGQHFKLFLTGSSTYYDYDAKAFTLTEHQMPQRVDYVNMVNDDYYAYAFAEGFQFMRYDEADKGIIVNEGAVTQLVSDYAVVAAGKHQFELLSLQGDYRLAVHEKTLLNDSHIFTLNNDGYATLYTLPVDEASLYSAHKTWEITFNDVVDATTINAQTITVVNDQGHAQHVKLRTNNNIVYVDAPSDGYVSGHYTLYVTNVMSNDGVLLHEHVEKAFSIR